MSKNGVSTKRPCEVGSFTTFLGGDNVIMENFCNPFCRQHWIANKQGRVVNFSSIIHQLMSSAGTTL